MKVKASLINDPFSLTLGAKVGVKPIASAPLDIDLTVKWVGDILDEAVQVSDMGHEAAPTYSPALETKLWGEQVGGPTDANAELVERYVQMLSRAEMPCIVVDPGAVRGDLSMDMRKVWLTGDFETKFEPIPREVYRDVPAPAATGLQLAASTLQRRFEMECRCEACEMKRPLSETEIRDYYRAAAQHQPKQKDREIFEARLSLGGIIS